VRSENGLESQILGFVQRAFIDGAHALVEEAHMKRWDVGD
jgi:hypothetical protein